MTYPYCLSIIILSSFNSHSLYQLQAAQCTLLIQSFQSISATQLYLSLWIVCIGCSGQTGITKHMLLLWAQALEPSIKDGLEVGLAISQLVYDGYLVKLNPNQKPIYFERVQ